MTSAQFRRAVITLMALGIAARVAATFDHPSVHPDEFFQYIEPAWWHLHGYGWRAWEWNVGLRSWVLPAYHGAWMVLLEWIGLDRPGQIYAALQVHWSVASALVVPAAADAGRRMSAREARAIDHDPGAPVVGWEAGLLAAGASAFLPILLYYGAHMLSEIPSMVLFVWGYAYWVRVRTGAPASETRRALVTGVLLSAGACLRIANGPLAALPALDLALRARWRSLGALTAGALGPLALFAAVDWATWGRPLHSMIEYVRFNLHGAGPRFGSSPPYEYLIQIHDELEWPGVACLVLPILAQWRWVWPWATGAGALLLVLSAEAHKENRFILVIWVFLAIACGAALGRLVARARVASARRVRWGLVALVACVVLGENARGLSRLPPSLGDGRWPVYRAQAWVGQHRDLTGLLVDGDFSRLGGWFMLGRNVPLESFGSSLLDDPLFNYFIVSEGSRDEAMCKEVGARRVWGGLGSSGGFVVLHR